MLLNWLYARHTGGSYVLRIEDTDRERSKQEFLDAILEDMRWLGLDGQSHEEQFDALWATCAQHEFDHLDGMLIKDRMTRVQTIGARRLIKEITEEYNEKNET